MQTPKVEDRSEAWWTAWETATEATEAYERTGQASYREAARGALRTGSFPNSTGLYRRLRRAQAHFSG